MIFVLLVLCSVPAWGTPLRDAAGKGATAKVLIEAGADVEAKDNTDGTDGMENIEEIYERMEANCPNPCATSKKLWELRRACDIASHNKSSETLLEKAVAMLAARGQMPGWFNQCPTASGITDSSMNRQGSKAVNKKSNVDLVHWDEANKHAHLVELKWEGDAPTSALRQILRYGAAYIFCLVHIGQLDFTTESLIEKNIRHVSLEVVAPAKYYLVIT